MKATVLLLLLASLVLGPARASAQATLITGLGGPLGFGSTSLARGDDAAGDFVDLTAIFPSGFDFYGQHYTGLYANTNGNVSFGQTVTTFTPLAFPLPPRPDLHPLVAAWWGDVDTRQTATSDSNLVYYAIDTANMRFVATWIAVGYFNQHSDLLNSFQIVLTRAADGTTFDVELRYNRCEWTTGDQSGGHDGLGGEPAQAGFDATDGVNFISLPGSLTMRVLDLCTTSNVGDRGVWRLHGAAMPVCGDMLLQTAEECDDGNTTSGDGCDANCMLECGGIAPSDAGMDAAMGMDAALDTGSSDAGHDAAPARHSCPDAGPPPPRPDTGPPPVDAYRPPPLDAGPPPPPVVDVTGGACSCTAAGTSSPRGALPLFLVLAALVKRRSLKARTADRPRSR